MIYRSNKEMFAKHIQIKMGRTSRSPLHEYLKHADIYRQSTHG